MSDALLRVSTVARRLDYARSTVYDLINAGRLPAVRVGNTIRVRESDLAEFIAALPQAVSA